MAPTDPAPRDLEPTAQLPSAQLREQTRLLWATVVGFTLGAIGGGALLHGATRPFAGAGGVIVPVALVAGVITAGAFIVSTRLHRPGETAPMPTWQAAISNLSAIAVTVALAAVTSLGVLLTGQVLAASLQGLELSTLGGGVLTGVAAALGARFAFHAGSALDAADLVNLLSAFNGTLIVAGLLIATVGSYIGRDLHRMLGDRALTRIAPAVLAWALAGAALAAVGLLPLDRAPVPHLIAAFSAVVIIAIASVLSMRAVPDPPRILRAATFGFIVLIVAVVGAALPFHLPMAAVEGVVVGLAILWLATFVRVLGILTPRVSVPSAVRRLIR